MTCLTIISQLIMLEELLAHSQGWAQLTEHRPWTIDSRPWTIDPHPCPYPIPCSLFVSRLIQHVQVFIQLILSSISFVRHVMISMAV